MKKIVCIDCADPGERLYMDQGLFEIDEDGWASRAALGLPLEEFAGARLLGIRRLETGMIELVLELPEQPAPKLMVTRELSQRHIDQRIRFVEEAMRVGSPDSDEDRRRVVRCAGEGDDLFLVDVVKEYHCYLLKIDPLTGRLRDITGWENVSNLTDVTPEERMQALALIDAAKPKEQRGALMGERV